MLPRILIILSFSFLSFSLCAQDAYVQLAFEYYNKGEYEKAIEYFKELQKDESNIPIIYPKYLESLIKLNSEKDARSLLKKLTKKYPDDVQYEIDEIFLERNFGSQDDFNKRMDDFIDRYTSSNGNLRSVSNVLVQKREFQLAEKFYISARKKSRNDYAYVQELIAIYRASGNDKGLVRESLNLLKQNSQNVTYAQNILQSIITAENYEELETELIKLLQKDGSGAINEMLVWLYIQVKKFDLAFFQAKALDKRFDLKGSELINLGKICFANKDYETAVDIYTYVIDKYPNTTSYAYAKQLRIETREEIVKNAFPVNLEQIRILINDYSSLIKELGARRNTSEAMRKMALLYAFYLGEHDTAITILDEAILVPRADQNFIAMCKLSLGDIYLLKDEPWESALLYSQVDKSFKDQPIGHEAKLKLAKLYYYKGDFQLAQDNLDILKLATSREIANDALDLSLLIQDNLALDTSDEALKKYAKIELMVFQKQLESAKNDYQYLLNEFPNHSLTDEIYWNLALINAQTGEFDEAIENLDNILNTHKDDIYGDDALFMKADLLENKLHKQEEAMEIYKEILFQYPGSIFNAEARKRFRYLRGDYN